MFEKKQQSQMQLMSKDNPTNDLDIARSKFMSRRKTIKKAGSIATGTALVFLGLGLAGNPGFKQAFAGGGGGCGGCDGGCYGGCYTSCSGGCSGSCSGTCTNGCTSECTG